MAGACSDSKKNSARRKLALRRTLLVALGHPDTGTEFKVDSVRCECLPHPWPQKNSSSDCYADLKGIPLSMYALKGRGV